MAVTVSSLKVAVSVINVQQKLFQDHASHPVERLRNVMQLNGWNSLGGRIRNNS